MRTGARSARRANRVADVRRSGLGASGHVRPRCAPRPVGSVMAPVRAVPWPGGWHYCAAPALGVLGSDCWLTRGNPSGRSATGGRKAGKGPGRACGGAAEPVAAPVSALGRLHRRSTYLHPSAGGVPDQARSGRPSPQLRGLRPYGAIGTQGELAVGAAGEGGRCWRRREPRQVSRPEWHGLLPLRPDAHCPGGGGPGPPAEPVRACVAPAGGGAGPVAPVCAVGREPPGPGRAGAGRIGGPGWGAGPLPALQAGRAPDWTGRLPPCHPRLARNAGCRWSVTASRGS